MIQPSGLAFRNKCFKRHVLMQYIDLKRRFPAPNQRQQTTTCRVAEIVGPRGVLEIPGNFQMRKFYL
jgi:hypothetical protein